ncbi:hypothetical protein Trydic_g22420 [Trypoxylus dichotomus]
MIDNSPETVGSLLDILQYFLGCSKFLQNANSALSYTFEFVLTNISYFIKRRDTKMLLKLINFMNALLSRKKFVLSATILEIDTGRISELIILLMETKELRYHLILLLRQLLSAGDIIVTELDTIVDICIPKFFSYMEPDCVELSMLAIAALRALPELTLDHSNVLYYWIYEECPKFLDKVTHEVKANVLDCLVLAYQTKKEKDFSLEIYLTNCRNDKVILDALKYTDTIDLLARCLIAKTNNIVPQRAATLLSQLHCPKTSILIRKQLPISIHSESSLSYLFRAKPALPQSENEGIFFCSMMSRVLPILTEKETFIGACSYTFKLLIKFKGFPKTAEEFILKEYCIVQVSEAAANDDNDVALPGIILLIMFLKLQKQSTISKGTLLMVFVKKRHSINVYQTTPLDFRKLIRGSTIRIRKSISLLKLYLDFRIPNSVISLRKSHVLNLYQHLQQLDCSEVYTETFEIMSRLLKIHPFLAYLGTTMLYIEMHCTRIFKTEDQIKHFTFFLADWLEEVSKIDMNLCGGLMSIYLFLKEQPNNTQVAMRLIDLLR